MKSKITQALTVSFAIATALALPTAVKAQEHTTTATAYTADEITTEANTCVYIPMIGWVC